MMKKQEYRNDCIILKTINDIVPKEHLVRKLDEAINLKFIEEEVESLYSKFGKPSVPPMVLFKLLIINYMFGINSMRKTCKECEVNMAYRWYLGLSIDDKIPDYSTWSQNYIRRYRNTEIFKTIFKKILKQAKEYKNMKTVYGDGTHQKASANKNKYEDKEVELEAKSYDEELLKEINEERAKINKKPYKSIEKKELDFDELTGEEIENVCLDAGYNTPAICKKIEETGKETLMPYSRQKGRKDKELFSKKEYEYNKELDCYVCSTGKTLELKTVDKQGYKIYKSKAKSCVTCPLKNKCTKSKNNQKVITRHIWQDKKDEVNKRRYEKKFKEEYPKRKETVERIFADCKEQHGLRFTRMRGLEKNANQALMIFTCHNLKKMAIWKANKDKNKTDITKNNIKNSILMLFIKIKRALFFNNTLLSTI